MYPEFDLAVPGTLEGALAELNNGQASVLPIAGGTNLVVDMRARRISPDKLVCLNNIAGFRDVKVIGGRVEIGGGTTISDILYSGDMPTQAPALFAAAEAFGGQMVRNTGTVAGNVCSGSPAADTVPPLLTLDAVLTLSSQSGDRDVPLSDYYTGFKQDVRRPDEILSKISWNTPPGNSVNLFYKLGLRKGDAITVAGVALLLEIQDGVCQKARIAMNSVAPVVTRAETAERLLEGQAVTGKLIEQAAACAAGESAPIDDIRATAEYRRHSVQVLTRRLLTRASQEIRSTE